MDWDYKENGKYFDIDLENGKKYRVDAKWVANTQKELDISEFEAIEMWLEDNEILDLSDEQQELIDKAKENKSNKIIDAKSTKPKKKTQKERVRKENPTKENLIKEISNFLQEKGLATNVIVENPTKIITFTIENDDFKLDLVQKRKKKQ